MLAAWLFVASSIALWISHKLIHRAYTPDMACTGAACGLIGLTILIMGVTALWPRSI